MKEWPIVLKKLNGTIVVNTDSRVTYSSKTLTKTTFRKQRYIGKQRKSAYIIGKIK